MGQLPGYAAIGIHRYTDIAHITIAKPSTAVSLLSRSLKRVKDSCLKVLNGLKKIEKDLMLF